MDPYIEGQEWEDFHHHFIEDLYNELAPQVWPRYLIRVETRNYVEYRADGVREAFLTIRLRESMDEVTVIEVLSPANKRPEAAGRREYLNRRKIVLGSHTHLVELDLLRGGERLPVGQLPPDDYYAFVSKRGRRHVTAVWACSLREPLPRIAVPLLEHEPDATADLQAVFTTAYDRAGYDYSLDRQRVLDPPLSKEDAAWVQSLLPDL
jgi:hypothetical protein